MLMLRMDMGHNVIPPFSRISFLPVAKARRAPSGEAHPHPTTPPLLSLSLCDRPQDSPARTAATVVTKATLDGKPYTLTPSQ
mmetsp:Transcript_903/g.2079  ORF Transcript_903/g.2079 Transcript_903/m.2079 type:complete len:82 (+) Transcript_903:25-270(+)